MAGPGSDPLQLVTSGQPVTISAETWNLMLQAAAGYQRQKLAAPLNSARDDFPDTDHVLIKNNTGADLSELSVLWATAPVISPATNQNEFKFHPNSLVGNAPDLSFVTGTLAITQGPIKNGTMGPAIIGGLSAVKLLVDGDHPAGPYAAAIAGVTGYMACADAGTAIVVWYDAASAPGQVWALVLLPVRLNIVTGDSGCPYVEGSGGAPYDNLVKNLQHLVFQKDDFDLWATNYTVNDGSGAIDTLFVSWHGLSVEFDNYAGTTCNDVKKLVFEGTPTAEFDSSQSNIFFLVDFDSTGSRCSTDSCTSISQATIKAFAPTTSEIIYQYSCSGGTLMASTKSIIVFDQGAGGGG